MTQQLHKRLSQEVVEKVLEAFNEHQISEEQACQMLGLKRARLYRLRREWLRKASKGEFTLSKRKSYLTRHLPEEVEKFLHQELTFIRYEADKYRGKFNFAVLTEEAEKKFGHPFHRNTFRRFALRHDYYHALPEEKEKVYQRFETAGIGMLFQHDTSHHLWIPALGRKQSLILSKDDYSRKFVKALITPRETSWDHLCLTRTTVEDVALPQAYYLDNHSIFRFCKHDGIHVTYIRKQDEGEVQFKRALKMLGVGIIYTGKRKPQAKGKVEKSFDYLQRRIPYLCERHKVKTVKEANKILEEVLWFYNEKRIQEETEEIPNRRWEKAVREGKDYLHPLSPEINLDHVFSLHYSRTVGKDGTISFEGKRYKAGCYPGRKVTVCLIPKVKFMIYKDNQKLWEYGI